MENFIIFLTIFTLTFVGHITCLPIGVPPNVDVERLNMTVKGDCHLRPVDKGIHGTVNNFKEFSKLVEYHITIYNYSTNPLEVNNTYHYKPYIWNRVQSGHGQTILNLAFNYGILSLMTLSFGISKVNIELEDEPPGCMGKLSEDDKVTATLDILLRDLDPKGPWSIFEGQSSMCHQYIKKVNGMAKFTDRCCYESVDNEGIACITDIPNRWLKILDILLQTITVVVFVFGPMMIPDWFYMAALDTLDYYVKLKEPLYKKLAVCRRDIAQDIDADHVLDLRNRRDFEKCRRIIAELPDDMIIPIKISQFDIKVNYRKLLVENKVPVGMIESLSRAIFLCKIRELDAFNDCCDANITGCIHKDPENKRPWIGLCNVFGRFLLVFCLPFPFYIRLFVYYMFESPEMMDRHEAANNLGLMVYYNFRLIQFLTPTHPLYLTIYLLYFLSGFTVAYFGGKNKKTRFQQAVMDAFQDMKDLSMLKAFEMLISNCLWPFKKYGIFGLFIGIILWPLLLPVSTLACCIYCLPLVFVSTRIVLHTFSSQVENKRGKFRPSPQHLHADKVLRRLQSVSTRKAAKNSFIYCHPNVKRFFIKLFLASFTLATLYALMLAMAEVITFVAEILSFTVMGVIVNAATVLKYGTLLFLVVLYSYDCYSIVNKKYLKLNKAIFSEIKFRLGKDIEQFTQLPSSIQENRGFKSAEASEQAEYESIDDLSYNNKFHWDINDMILFIDKEDTPRIPKKLFDDVCSINAAGAPGPVYRSLLDATRKLIVISSFLGFVFIVVLSFGQSYKISSANQMLATMAGGFAPFMFRKVFNPGKAEVETSLLSFKSKLEEIIKNFVQPWPMYEFVFDIEEEPKSEDEEEDKIEEFADVEDKCECHCMLASQQQQIVAFDFDKKALDVSYKHQDSNSEKGDKPVCCSKHANISSKHSSVKSKDGEKDKKDKGKKDKGDKKKSGIDWLTLIMRTKNVALNDIKEKIDGMILEPAEGKKVDILVYVSDIDQEWSYEESVIDFEEDEEKTELPNTGTEFMYNNGMYNGLEPSSPTYIPMTNVV